MDKKEIFRYILTAIVAVASALLSVFFSSCASTTRVVTRSTTTQGSASSTVTVTTDARQDLEMKVDSSLNLTFPARKTSKQFDMPFFKTDLTLAPVRSKEIALPIGQCAFTPTEIVPLLTVEKQDDTNELYVRHLTDNYLLLHQNDLENRLGPDGLRAFLDNVRRSQSMSDEVQKALDGMTDEQLFAAVRSRHIQQPADAAAYLESLTSEADKLANRRDRLVEQIREAQTPPVQTPPAETSSAE